MPSMEPKSLLSKHSLSSKPYFSSSYWETPDKTYNLTSLASNPNVPFIAVASACADANLFIYQSNHPLNDTPELYHHRTVTMKPIYSLAWMPQTNNVCSSNGLLLTGHANNVTLVKIPDPRDDEPLARSLIKYKHPRHLDPSEITSTRIKTLNVVGPSWTCCTNSSFVSLFSNHLFLWDSSRGDTPIVKQRFKASSFDTSPFRNGVVSLATDCGISILDIRYKNPSPLAPPPTNSSPASLIKWSPLNENVVASVHDQSLVQIWDIRAGAPLYSFDGHFDKVNAIDWSLSNSNLVYSASSDGTVRLWDLENPAVINQTHYSPPLSTNKHHPNTKWSSYRQRNARKNYSPHFNYYLDKNHGKNSPPTIYNSKKEFIALGNIQLKYPHSDSISQILTIDNGGFFAMHSPVPKTQPPSVSHTTLGQGFQPKHDMSRLSMESLASATSKSTNGDSDSNNDDTHSDSSANSSPSMSSSPSVNSSPNSSLSSPPTKTPFAAAPSTIPVPVPFSHVNKPIPSHQPKRYSSFDRADPKKSCKKVQFHKRVISYSPGMNYFATVEPLKLEKHAPSPSALGSGHCPKSAK